MNRHEFLATPKGALARHRSRQRRRIHLWIEGIEPQSKKMRDAQQDLFQAAVEEALRIQKRGPFAGAIALKLDLFTSAQNPPHAHTIAKNLLDLLGARRTGVAGRYRHLLYRDDQQIQALSVSCRHGEDHPLIGIEACPFSLMLDDLELATEIVRENEMHFETAMLGDLQDDAIDHFRRLRRDEAASRARLGDETYDALFKLSRWSAQRALLAKSAVTVPILGWMYGLPKHVPVSCTKAMWADLFSQSKLRLQVGSLPTVKGSSDAFKAAIDAEIALFKHRWGWIIDPLVVPIALEVVIRPDPATPRAVLHDLDNVVRDYLLPKIVPSFGTVSDVRWTVDFDQMRESAPEVAKYWGPASLPPKQTRVGVTRYEGWRLPTESGNPGFVSVALISDTEAAGDLMDQVREHIRGWEKKLERD